MERYHLAKDRISEICIEKTAQPDFEDFFKKTAAFLTKTAAILEREKEELTEEELTDGNIDILTMLVKSGLTASKSEARRAVQQGGVSVDGEKVTDVFQTFAGEALSGEGVVLKKGKKNFRKVLVK